MTSGEPTAGPQVGPPPARPRAVTVARPRPRSPTLAQRRLVLGHHVSVSTLVLGGTRSWKERDPRAASVR